jgi:hypothetical protein
MDAPTRKFVVGGLKLSPELVQIRLVENDLFPITEMLQRLSDRQINLIGVIFDASEGHLAGVCNILAEDRLPAEEALHSFTGCFEVSSSIGMMTIFPIQSRRDLLHSLLSALGQAGLPVYNFSSSLSSLTITTDFHRLDEAVAAVSRVIDLPENHAPFRPEFKVKQL